MIIKSRFRHRRPRQRAVNSNEFGFKQQKGAFAAKRTTERNANWSSSDFGHSVVSTHSARHSIYPLNFLSKLNDGHNNWEPLVLLLLI